MNQIIEPPDAIIVTLPKRFFVEYNHEKYLQELKDFRDDQVWYRVCKNVPKQDVLYVYTIIDNKVHHRSNFVGIERNKTYRFARPDGKWRTWENANAILTSGPIVLAPNEIAWRGFQGFRYCKILFSLLLILMLPCFSIAQKPKKEMPSADETIYMMRYILVSLQADQEIKHFTKWQDLEEDAMKWVKEEYTKDSMLTAHGRVMEVNTTAWFDHWRFLHRCRDSVDASSDRLGLLVKEIDSLENSPTAKYIKNRRK